jgi:hypothetical protein
MKALELQAQYRDSLAQHKALYGRGPGRSIRKFALLALLVLMFGCKSPAPFDPYSPVYGIHKVWLGPNIMTYQDRYGFPCGHIDRMNNGWIYHAEILGPKHDVSTDWNSFSDAEAFVEQRCKP